MTYFYFIKTDWLTNIFITLYYWSNWQRSLNVTHKTTVFFSVSVRYKALKSKDKGKKEQRTPYTHTLIKKKKLSFMCLLAELKTCCMLFSFEGVNSSFESLEAWKTVRLIMLCWAVPAEVFKDACVCMGVCGGSLGTEGWGLVAHYLAII